ncbi:hypothetical protein MMC20_007613 [Loxospora ochrophaea]|nr:hypothetical protein [Loxospora ochrophaea]
MVLFGLGVLLVSTLFVAYRYPAIIWFPRRAPQRPRFETNTNTSSEKALGNEEPKPRSHDNEKRKLSSQSQVGGEELVNNSQHGLSPAPEAKAFKATDGSSMTTPSNPIENARVGSMSGKTSSKKGQQDDAADLQAADSGFPSNSHAATSSGTMSTPTQTNLTPHHTAKNPPQPSMLPPPRPTATSRPVPKPSTTLRPPPSAASALRAPPSRLPSKSSNSLAPSTSTLAPSSRSSRKVLLEPGHSPLDWAHLTSDPPTPTFLRGAGVPPQLIRVPPSLLQYHNGRKGRDAWGVWQGKVYNLTPYMKFHPGGEDQLRRGAGKIDAGEKLFNEIHPWINWEGMLRECLVGILVGENEAQSDGGGGALEEMD